MLESPKSLNALSQVIKQKEKELHEIHDLRCSKLEKLLEERDELLLESSRRFEQLKEDFKYNLTLIEERDKEIEELESNLSIMNRNFENCESECKRLSTRLIEKENKEIERLKKQDAEKIKNKVKIIFILKINY